jgi:hypothetical protein
MNKKLFKLLGGQSRRVHLLIAARDVWIKTECHPR